MIKKLAFCAATLLTALISTPIQAQALPKLNTQNVDGKGLVKLDPNKAYLLVESTNARAISTFVQIKEGSDATDPYSAIGYLRFGPENRFIKAEGTSAWLHEVPEGEYYFYGLSWYQLADCACMGLVRFRVEKGRVTTIRVATAILDPAGNQLGRGNRGDDIPDGRGETDLLTMRSLAVGHPQAELIAGRLRADLVKPADFLPVQSIPNWFSLPVSRVLPLSGVLSYDGAKIVDLRPNGPPQETR